MGNTPKKGRPAKTKINFSTNSSNNEMIVEKVKSLLALSLKVDEISERLNLSIEEVKKIREIIYFEENESDIFKANSLVFADFLLKQKYNISKLENLIQNFEASGSVSGAEGQVLLGAIKLRGDLLEKIIKVGQSLGVICEKPEQIEIYQKDLSTSELIQEYKKNIAEFKKLEKEYNISSRTDLDDLGN